MKKLIILLYVLIPLNTLFPQQAEPKKSTEDIIKSLYQENKFDEILSVKDTLKGKYLTPDVCLYIGLSYYLETDYKNALVYLNKGINKKPDYYILLYFKGRVYKDMKKYKEAFDAFDEAIEADNSRSSSLTEEAEMYMEQSKYKEAFKLLKKAVSKKKVLGKAYFLLAEIYYEQRNDPENALKTLYKGKEKNEKDDEYYFSIKFYIGFIERDKKNYVKSNEVFLDLLFEKPDEYYVLPYVIRNYFSLNQIDSAKPFQQLLYIAHSQNKLDEDMDEEYFFDSFKWKDKNAYGYEMFKVPDYKNDVVFHKQTYYFYNEQGDEEFTIQTELFISLEGEQEKTEYVLGRSQTIDDMYLHWTFGDLKYTEPVDYRKLKDDIIKVLEGKVKPTTMSKSKRNE